MEPLYWTWSKMPLTTSLLITLMSPNQRVLSLDRNMSHLDSRKIRKKRSWWKNWMALNPWMSWKIQRLWATTINTLNSSLDGFQKNTRKCNYSTEEALTASKLKIAMLNVITKEPRCLSFKLLIIMLSEPSPLNIYNH